MFTSLQLNSNPDYIKNGEDSARPNLLNPRDFLMNTYEQTILYPRQETT